MGEGTIALAQIRGGPWLGAPSVSAEGLRGRNIRGGIAATRHGSGERSGGVATRRDGARVGAIVRSWVSATSSSSVGASLRESAKPTPCEFVGTMLRARYAVIQRRVPETVTSNHERRQKKIK